MDTIIDGAMYASDDAYYRFGIAFNADVPTTLDITYEEYDAEVKKFIQKEAITCVSKEVMEVLFNHAEYMFNISKEQK